MLIDFFFLFFLVVKGNRKCELNCQAMGYRFYVRQAEKVIDGTPCDQNGTAICVSGQCKVSAPGLGCQGGFLGCLSSDCLLLCLPDCGLPPPTPSPWALWDHELWERWKETEQLGLLCFWSLGVVISFSLWHFSS